MVCFINLARLVVGFIEADQARISKLLVCCTSCLLFCVCTFRLAYLNDYIANNFYLLSSNLIFISSHVSLHWQKYIF